MMKFLGKFLLYVSTSVLIWAGAICFSAIWVVITAKPGSLDPNKAPWGLILGHSTLFLSIVIGFGWADKIIAALSSVRGESKDFNPEDGGSIPPRGTKGE